MAYTAVVATPSGANSNSYATIAEAGTYHDGQMYADDWYDSDTEMQSRALITATRMLDTWFEWRGDISTLGQALLWPRRGVLRPGISEAQGQSIITNPWHEPFGGLLPSDEIPDLIRDATAELARQLLVSNRQADNDTQTQGIKRLEVEGAVNIEFRNDVTSKPIPDAVMAMCSQLGTPRGKTGAGAISMRRG